MTRAPSKRVKPFAGRIRIGPFSGLRKLMRAAARGKIPDERTVLIADAQAEAARKPERWLGAHARRRLREATHDHAQPVGSPMPAADLRLAPA